MLGARQYASTQFVLHMNINTCSFITFVATHWGKNSATKWLWMRQQPMIYAALQASSFSTVN